MIPVGSFVSMVITAVICFGLPLGGLWFLRSRRDPEGDRRYPGLGRAFLCGMLAFGVSQLLLRLPLMTLVVPQLPEPVSGFLLSGPVASYSAGLFEETGRLVVMVLLLRRFHRWADGLAFGLGHGGLEAMALTGLTTVSNFVLAVLVNTGRWDMVAAGLPADQAGLIRQSLVSTPPDHFLLAGVERIGAIAVHVGLSVLVLWGVHRSRRLLAWVAAVLLHGTVNLTVILTMQAGASLWLVEAVVLAWGAALVTGAVRLRPAFPRDVEPDLRTLPAPSSGSRQA